MSETSHRPPRTARLARRTLRGLPPKRFETRHQPALRVPAADGTVLLTDRHHPVGPGPFPTVLLRSPYGRGFPWAPLYGLALAEQGFEVLIQSCRGTGGSGGVFRPWRDERADGLATVEWLRGQPWFDGRLGTVGPSYLGYVQWALAADPPPELRAMVVQNGIHDPYGFFRSGGSPGTPGVFDLENALVASVGLEHFQHGFGALLRAAMRLQRGLRAATRGLPLRQAYTTGTGGAVPVLAEAMDHPEPSDPYWHGADLGAVAGRTSVPTALVTGWWDVQLGQTLRQWERLGTAGTPRALLIGPWTHTSTLGPGRPETFREMLAWLRAHLADDPSGLREHPVRLHTGTGWREAAAWPPAGKELLLHLDGTRLTDRPAPGAEPLRLRADPGRPVPSVGGALLSAQAGPRRVDALGKRADVLSLDGEPATAPVRLLGPVALELTVSAGHFDLYARLCDVDPRGRATHLTDGVLRLVPGDDRPAAVTLTLDPTTHLLAPGHRLRLQLSPAPHPRYARNPGTGESDTAAARLAPARATLHPGAVLRLTVEP
ncbi:CocE/NonD family hydrolase [Kitasatospora sp. NPDC096147]|uniref:CocE/NonD family hydrolase n=1 Tax=Kitasatospora sp. NPDC096147 TaxID=3364093 RepID=UPI00382F8639